MPDVEKSDYDPKTLIPFLGMSQLLNPEEFIGSYAFDKRCLEKNNFKELKKNDPNWKHLTIKSSKMGFLQTDGRNKFDLAAKGLSITIQTVSFLKQKRLTIFKKIHMIFDILKLNIALIKVGLY